MPSSRNLQKDASTTLMELLAIRTLGPHLQMAHALQDPRSRMLVAPHRRRVSIAVSLVALVLGSVAPRAEPAPDPSLRSMTLEDALAYARQHQPQIRSALAEFAARTAEARIPRAQWLPRVGGTAQLFYGTNNNSSAMTLGVAGVDLPRTGGTPGRTPHTARWSPDPSTLAALSLDQEIYDFGRIAAQASVADALTQVARNGADAAGFDVALAVEESFHGVLAAKQVLEATEAAYARTETHRDSARVGVHSGLRSPIDMTRAQADLAQLEVQRVRARSGVRTARAALAAAMGSDALEVDAQPSTPDGRASPAFDEVLRIASARNPLILTAVARLEAQRSTTRALTREFLPNLFGSAGLSGRAGGATPSSGAANVPYGEGWLPDVPNWHVGLVLSWTLFDGALLARRSASVAREAAMRANLELARSSVTFESQRAFVDLRAALEVLPGLAEAVVAARANQAQADARFRAGLGNVVELADAEGLLTTSELQLAVGQFTVARTRAALGRVMAEPNSNLRPASTGTGRVR